MTVNSLLTYSLANLRSRSASLSHQQVATNRESDFGLSRTLLAARVQNAELVVSRYLNRPGYTAADNTGHQLEGWVFHR